MPRYLIALGCALLLACDATPSEPPADTTPTVTILNATRVDMQLTLDGTALPDVPASVATQRIVIQPGAHQISFTWFDTLTTSAELAFVARVGDHVDVMGYQPTGNVQRVALLSASTGDVPSGRSRVRLLHLAPDAPPLEVWRVQPDLQAAARIVTSFAFSPEPSAQVDGDAGTWRVWVTPTGDPSVVATTGDIRIGGGEQRTVALVDSAGVLRLRVLSE